jgi:hypothetical protein
MPKSKSSKLPNIEDLIILAMAIIGLIIAIHAILMMNTTPPSNPTTMVVIPKLMPISLIAP